MSKDKTQQIDDILTDNDNVDIDSLYVELLIIDYSEYNEDGNCIDEHKAISDSLSEFFLSRT